MMDFSKQDHVPYICRKCVEVNKWKSLAKALAAPLEEILRQDVYIDGTWGGCGMCAGKQDYNLHKTEPELWENGWHAEIADKECRHKEDCEIKKAIEALKKFEKARSE